MIILSLDYHRESEWRKQPDLYKGNADHYNGFVRRDGIQTVKPTSARARWKAEAVLEELKELAVRVGLEVREEKLLREVGYQVRSGACRVREQDLVLIDRDLPAPNRLEILVEILSTRDLGDVYVSPELRRILGREEPV